MGFIIDIAYNNVTTKNINGQDVNIPPDWSHVQGVDACICKVTELVGTDNTFAANWHGIGARGIPRAGYHYFHNNQIFYNSARQAKAFSDAILAQGGIKPNDYFILDNEEIDAQGNPLVSLSQSLDWFYNVMLNLGLGTADKPDYSRFWLYSTASILNGLNTGKLNAAQLSILKQIKIWVAGYPNTPPQGEWLTILPAAYTPNPNIYGKVIGWQFAESQIVPTMPGGTDLNQINQDFFNQWSQGQNPVPAPQPAPPTNTTVTWTIKSVVTTVTMQGSDGSIQTTTLGS